MSDEQPRVIFAERRSERATDGIRELRNAGASAIVIALDPEGVDKAKHRPQLFAAGADDCVARDCTVGEILARGHAHIRRESGELSILHSGPLSLDERNGAAFLAAEKIQLTSVEFAILCHLVREADDVVERRALLELIWSKDDPFSNRSLDVHVSRLRRNLGPLARNLLTIRGVGFMWRLAADTQSRATKSKARR